MCQNWIVGYLAGCQHFGAAPPDRFRYGHPIRTLYDLYDALEAHEIGDTARVTYVRDDNQHEVAVQLQRLN